MPGPAATPSGPGRTKRAGPGILPNVGAVPYGSAVEETAAVLDVLPAAPGLTGADPAGADPAGADPAGADPAVGEPPGPALSPSRAADFMTCPLLYRFRVIDRLPEPPSEATARGTLVHAALERLFDLPAADRTPAAARALLAPEWDRLAAEEPDLAALFPDEAGRASWLQSATAIIDAYFTLEDPRRLEPAAREAYVETTLDSGLRLRGYVDRLDVAPGGEMRIVDYKTGRAPREAYEASGNQAHRAVTGPGRTGTGGRPGSPGPEPADAESVCTSRARSLAARVSRRTAIALAGGGEARYFASAGRRAVSSGCGPNPRIPPNPADSGGQSPSASRRLARAETYSAQHSMARPGTATAVTGEPSRVWQTRTQSPASTLWMTAQETWWSRNGFTIVTPPWSATSRGRSASV